MDTQNFILILLVSRGDTNSGCAALFSDKFQDNYRTTRRYTSSLIQNLWFLCFALKFCFSSIHVIWHFHTSYSSCSQVVGSSQTRGLTQMQQQLLFSLPKCSLSMVSLAHVTWGCWVSDCVKRRINGTENSSGHCIWWVVFCFLTLGLFNKNSLE